MLERPRGRSGKYAGRARDGANVLTHPYYPTVDRTHHIGAISGILC